MFTAIPRTCGICVTFIVLIVCHPPTPTLVFQDYEDFFLSKENNTVFTFLGLHSRPSEKVRMALSTWLQKEGQRSRRLWCLGHFLRPSFGFTPALHPFFRLSGWG